MVDCTVGQKCTDNYGDLGVVNMILRFVLNPEKIP